MTVEIRRKNIGGKYYVVHTDGKRQVEKIRWSARPKKDGTTNLRSAISNFKENNSIYPDRKRFTGASWKVVEETRFRETNYKKIKGKRPSIQKRRGIKYQYYVDGVIYSKSGKYTIVAASSRAHDSDYPVDAARDEAITSFFERADFIYHGEGNYDADEGVKLVENGKVEIKREGIKHYIEK